MGVAKYTSEFWVCTVEKVRHKYPSGVSIPKPRWNHFCNTGTGTQSMQVSA